MWLQRKPQSRVIFKSWQKFEIVITWLHFIWFMQSATSFTWRKSIFQAQFGHLTRHRYPWTHQNIFFLLIHQKRFYHSSAENKNLNVLWGKLSYAVTCLLKMNKTFNTGCSGELSIAQLQWKIWLSNRIIQWNKGSNLLQGLFDESDKDGQKQGSSRLVYYCRNLLLMES